MPLGVCVCAQYPEKKLRLQVHTNRNSKLSCFSSSLCGLGQLLSHSILPGKTELKLYAPANSIKTYEVCSVKVSADVKEDSHEWFECANFQGTLKI